MNAKAWCFVFAGIALFALAFGSTGAELTDLGSGLLMRSDGSVVAAWELPGCDMARNAFDAPDASIAMQATPPVWRERFDRGW